MLMETVAKKAHCNQNNSHVTTTFCSFLFRQFRHLTFVIIMPTCGPSDQRCTQESQRDSTQTVN